MPLIVGKDEHVDHEAIKKQLEQYLLNKKRKFQLEIIFKCLKLSFHHEFDI